MGKKIIFIDDNKNLLSSLERILRKYSTDWDIKFIDDPEKGLQTVLRELPDIIFVDYKMPRLNGLELLQAVKEKLPDTVLVLLSGQSEEEIFYKAKEVVDYYIEKPCDNDKIIELINSV